MNKRNIILSLLAFGIIGLYSPYAKAVKTKLTFKNDTKKTVYVRLKDWNLNLDIRHKVKPGGSQTWKTSVKSCMDQNQIQLYDNLLGEKKGTFTVKKDQKQGDKDCTVAEGYEKIVTYDSVYGATEKVQKIE